MSVSDYDNNNCFMAPVYRTTQLPEETVIHSYLSWSSKPSFVSFLHLLQSLASSYVQFMCLIVFLHNLWSGTIYFVLHKFLHPVDEWLLLLMMLSYPAVKVNWTWCYWTLVVFHARVVVWRNNNIIGCGNEVILCQAWWVWGSPYGQTISVYNQPPRSSHSKHRNNDFWTKLLYVKTG